MIAESHPSLGIFYLSNKNMICNDSLMDTIRIREIVESMFESILLIINFAFDILFFLFYSIILWSNR